MVTVGPEGGGSPVVVVVAEAVHLLVAALAVVRQRHLQLPLQLLLLLTQPRFYQIQ